MAIENITGLPPASAHGGAPSQPAVRARPGVAREPAADRSQQYQVEPKVDAASVQRAAEAINEQLRAAAQNIRFSVDEETGKTVVRVVDAETGDLIRQIPTEEAMAISRSLARLQGVLFDQEA
jgi:flagellar protein FlaG